MKMTKQQYKKMADKAAPPSPILKNVIIAYVSGGLICLLGQGLSDLYTFWGLDKETCAPMVSVSLVLLGVLLTALGWYDKIAKHCGAGTLVPITGFANSVASPAIEFKSEGYVSGLSAKMFVVAGPVIVYSTAASAIYGVVLVLNRLVGA